MAAGNEDGARPHRPARTERTDRTDRADSSADPATSPSSRPADGVRQRPKRRVSAPQAMRNAAEQLAELLGRPPESVSALKPTEDGWQADVEVVELDRVPDTTSVMASYRVTLDEDGELVAYERVNRYTRGQIDRR